MSIHVGKNWYNGGIFPTDRHTKKYTKNLDTDKQTNKQTNRLLLYYSLLKGRAQARPDNPLAAARPRVNYYSSSHALQWVICKVWIFFLFSIVDFHFVGEK